MAAVFPPEGAVPLAVPFFVETVEQDDLVDMFIASDPAGSYVRAEPVIQVLRNRLPDARIHVLQTQLTDGFLQLKDITASGVTIAFDESVVALSLTVPSENRREQTVTVRPVYNAQHRDVIAPAPVSAYANIRGSQDYRIRGDPENRGRQPIRMRSDGAVNVKGVVLEGAADYQEGDARPIAREDVRLVYDLPDRMVRLAAGDLSYPVTGFQSFQQMAGVTVARNFDLQPYRVSEPTGRHRSF